MCMDVMLVVCAVFKLQIGPSNPKLTQQAKSVRNTLAGLAEMSHFNDFQFENQRRTFTSFGELR